MLKWPKNTFHSRAASPEDEMSTAPPSIVPDDMERQQIEKEIVPDKVSAFKGGDRWGRGASVLQYGYGYDMVQN